MPTTLVATMTLFTLLLGMGTAMTPAEVVTATVAYRHGDVELEGFLAYDNALEGRRPAVLVVHEWWGLNNFAREQARRLAALGYVALAVDMYGKGVLAETPDKARALATAITSDQALWRGRIQAAVAVVKQDARVDPARVAAIGFCFGGTTVLQLAATGEDVAAVVCFHGSLPPFSAADAGRTKARLLILHGAADTLIPDTQVNSFVDSLRVGQIDWQLVYYAGAKHGFMNRAADDLKMEGVGYDATAARRAWAQMRAFLDEVFNGAPESVKPTE